MSNIIQRFMDELPQSQLLGVAIAIIVIGLLICFFGYKLMRVGITVIGFSIGFFITAFIVNYFTNNIKENKKKILILNPIKKFKVI